MILSISDLLNDIANGKPTINPNKTMISNVQDIRMSHIVRGSIT